MEGTDMAVVRKNATGGWVITDYWSLDFVAPKPDPVSQDWVLISAATAGNVTTAHFWRAMDTCQPEEDMRFLRATQQYFVWARGMTWAYHGDTNRGNTVLELLPAPATPKPAPSSVSVKSAGAVGGAASAASAVAPAGASESTFWDVRMDNVTIPSTETSYICKHFAVPDVRACTAACLPPSHRLT
jgi:hypothetical protein